MKKFASLILFFLFVWSVAAGNIDKGTIKIEIINMPPEITDIKISPADPYPDEEIECMVEVNDESPQTSEIFYKWFVNGLQVENAESKYFGVEEGDSVACTAIAQDREGLLSEPVKSIVTVSKVPVRTKMIKPVLALVGSSTNIREITSKTRMSEVTGMVTGSSAAGNLFLMLIVFGLIILNVNLFGRVVAKIQR